MNIGHQIVNEVQQGQGHKAFEEADSPITGPKRTEETGPSTSDGRQTRRKRHATSQQVTADGQTRVQASLQVEVVHGHGNGDEGDIAQEATAG